MSLPASIDPSEVAHISRAQYDRMVESGALEEANVELIEGVIVAMSPQGREHAGVVEVLAQLLRDALGTRVRVREEKPFAASDDSEPEPDIAVVEPTDPFARHPDVAFLVVEVASTSLKRDRAAKASLYARSQVPEYWVVNLVDRVVEAHSAPASGAYQTMTLLRRGDARTLVAFPDVSIEIARFLR